MNNEESILLLLTCCVDPKGMSFTKLSDVDLRVRQYYDAFDFYLANTTLKLLIVENTLFKIDEKYLNNDRIEYLTFDGNNFDKSLGKGYGEALIIDYALNNSKFLTLISNPVIVKITGRLKVINIMKILNNRKYNNQKTFISANVTWKMNFAYSHFFISSFDVLQEFVLKKKSINDSEGYYFEHLLIRLIKKFNKQYSAFVGFNSTVEVRGRSGSTGESYKQDGYLAKVNRPIKNLYVKKFLK
ncbi:MAG: hypothetical protein LBE37_07705 [Sphingobacterium sp.]|jgi:hypothetical protein|nr:hypothetical protein [Sphingobacterium sp.]